MEKMTMEDWKKQYEEWENEAKKQTLETLPDFVEALIRFSHLNHGNTECVAYTTIVAELAGVYAVRNRLMP